MSTSNYTQQSTLTSLFSFMVNNNINLNKNNMELVNSYSSSLLPELANNQVNLDSMLSSPKIKEILKTHQKQQKFTDHTFDLTEKDIDIGAFTVSDSQSLYEFIKNNNGLKFNSESIMALHIKEMLNDSIPGNRFSLGKTWYFIRLSLLQNNIVKDDCGCVEIKLNSAKLEIDSDVYFKLIAKEYLSSNSTDNNNNNNDSSIKDDIDTQTKNICKKLSSNFDTDPKGAIQEYSHAIANKLPIYSTEREEDSLNHKSSFVSSITVLVPSDGKIKQPNSIKSKIINGPSLEDNFIKLTIKGRGSSKKSSQINAAKNIILKLFEFFNYDSNI